MSGGFTTALEATKPNCSGGKASVLIRNLWKKTAVLDVRGDVSPVELKVLVCRLVDRGCPAKWNPNQTISIGVFDGMSKDDVTRVASKCYQDTGEDDEVLSFIRSCPIEILNDEPSPEIIQLFIMQHLCHFGWWALSANLIAHSIDNDTIERSVKDFNEERHLVSCLTSRIALSYREDAEWIEVTLGEFLLSNIGHCNSEDRGTRLNSISLPLSTARTKKKRRSNCDGETESFRFGFNLNIESNDFETGGLFATTDKTRPVFVKHVIDNISQVKVNCPFTTYEQLCGYWRCNYSIVPFIDPGKENQPVFVSESDLVYPLGTLITASETNVDEETDTDTEYLRLFGVSLLKRSLELIGERVNRTTKQKFTVRDIIPSSETDLRADVVDKHLCGERQLLVMRRRSKSTSQVVCTARPLSPLELLRSMAEKGKQPTKPRILPHIGGRQRQVAPVEVKQKINNTKEPQETQELPREKIGKVVAKPPSIKPIVRGAKLSVDNKKKQPETHIYEDSSSTEREHTTRLQESTKPQATITPIIKKPTRQRSKAQLQQTADVMENKSPTPPNTSTKESDPQDQPKQSPSINTSTNTNSKSPAQGKGSKRSTPTRRKPTIKEACATNTQRRKKAPPTHPHIIINKYIVVKDMDSGESWMEPIAMDSGVHGNTDEVDIKAAFLGGLSCDEVNSDSA